MDVEKRIRIRNLDVLIPPRKKNRLRWKEYQILSLLVARSPELVSRSEIIENIWKGTYCSDSTINQTIKSIRQKIGDNKHTIISTIPRLGYKVEDKLIFHFISEEDPFVPDASWLNTAVSEDDIKEDLSEIDDKNLGKEGKEKVAENPIQRDLIVKEVSWPLKKVVTATKRYCSNGFTPRLPIRVMKYLAVFVSLLIISLLSYLLGSHVKQPVMNNVQNNPKLVLSLTLNSPRNSHPQALICLYHEDNKMEARIECVDPKPTMFQEKMKYELYAVNGKQSVLPH